MNTISRSHVRMGMAGYARIVRALRDKPSTWPELVKRGLLGRTAASRLVSNLHSLGFLYVASWRLIPDKPYMPVYAVGPGEDAPMPTTRPSGRPVACQKPPTKPRVCAPELLAFFTLYEALQAPSTSLSLAEETGIFIRTVYRAVEAMLECKLIHVADWDVRSNGMQLEMYRWGNKRSVPRYPSKNRTKRQRDRRQELRKLAKDRKVLAFDYLAAQCVANLPATNDSALIQRA